jgi:hypothetical protein
MSETGFVFLQGEQMHPGGAAKMTAVSVASSLLAEPMAGVSPLLQVSRVTAREHLIERISVVSLGEPSTSEDPQSVPLAVSLAEFVVMCQQGG